MTIVFFDAYKNTYSKPASTSMKMKISGSLIF